MTTAKKANQRAETKTEAQRSIAGAGSPKTAGNRPGHKTHS